MRLLPVVDQDLSVAMNEVAHEVVDQDLSVAMNEVAHEVVDQDSRGEMGSAIMETLL